MVKIFVARHGQDEDNAAGILNGRRDSPLTTIGLEQAKALASKIQSENLDIIKVFSSPLRRAYKTATEVADLLRLEQPVVLDLLIERDFGIMTGESVNDIERLCAPNIIRTSTITYFLSPQGAETFPQLLARATALLEWLRENESDKSLLLVTHGDIGKMIYCAFYQLNWRDVLTEFHFGNSDVLLLAEGSTPEERYVHKVSQHNH